MMLPNCSPWSTRSHALKENGVLHDAGQTSFKEIEPMIPSRTAGRSKKGDKLPPGQTSHRPWQRLGHNTLVCRTAPGLAASVPKTENAGGEISSHSRGADASGLLGHLLPVPQLLILQQALLTAAQPMHRVVGRLS